MQTLGVRGCPEPMLDYLRSVYSDAISIITSDGWQSHAIHPRHGVRQVDPLSPFIFNMVMDRLLKSQPDEVGEDIDGVKVGAIAFADDLVLTASKAGGLQQLLNSAGGFLALCGMSVSTGKFFSVSIGTVPRQKKTTVDPGTFLLGGQKFVAKQRTEIWKYLGDLFTPEGRMRFEPTTLSNALLRISKAPLKPQQRLFALRIYLLPGLYHAASLGAIRV